MGTFIFLLVMIVLSLVARSASGWISRLMYDIRESDYEEDKGYRERVDTRLNRSKGVIKKILTAITLLLTIFTCVNLTRNTFYIIKPGEVGIEIFLGRVRKYAPSGFNAKVPYLSEVKKFSIRTIKNDYETEAPTSDIQQIIVKCRVQAHVKQEDVGKLYNEKVKDPELVSSICIDPFVESAIKSATVQYKIADVLANRANIQSTVLETLRERISAYYLEVESIQIKDITLSADYLAAIEKKQIARLKKLKQERNNQKMNEVLSQVRDVAKSDENVMPALIEAVKAYATVGEISDALRDVFGEYREPSLL